MFQNFTFLSHWFYSLSFAEKYFFWRDSRIMHHRALLSNVWLLWDWKQTGITCSKKWFFSMCLRNSFLLIPKWFYDSFYEDWKVVISVVIFNRFNSIKVPYETTWNPHLEGKQNSFTGPLSNLRATPPSC